MTTDREALREIRRARHAEQRSRPTTVEGAEANAGDVRRSLRVRVRWALIADGLRNGHVDPIRAAHLITDVPLAELAPVLGHTVGRMRRSGLIRGDRLTDSGRNQ